MSTEEDIEVRDLIVQKTLIPNGCLAKVRAQLRASIFLALSEDKQVMYLMFHKGIKLKAVVQLQDKAPLKNEKVASLLQSKEGTIMFCLVREFLEFCDLHFTIAVYDPESYLGSAYHYDGKYKLIEELGIPVDENSDVPILIQLIRLIQQNLSSQESKVLENEKRSTKRSNEHNNLEDQNNKSSTTISEELDSRENSMETSSKSINDFPKCVTEIKTTPKENKLNVTFNLSNPTFKNDLRNDETKKSEVFKESISEKSVHKNVDTILSNRSIGSTNKEETFEKDDTYEGTSSIAEDSVSKELEKESTDINKTYVTSQHTPHEADQSKLGNESSLGENEVSPPIVKDGKHLKFDTSSEKLKLASPKSDKMKVKNSLSSLADLPPLQLNKSRGNDTMLLPSLYKKEKSKLKEFDKLLDLDFDSLDNYEEDFMSGTELDIALNNTDFLAADASAINLMDLSNPKPSPGLDRPKLFRNRDKFSDVESYEKKNCTFSGANGIILSGDKDASDILGNKDASFEKSAFSTGLSVSVASTVTSEDFELSSNVEDILNSSASK